MADARSVTKKLEQVARGKGLATYEPLMAMVGLRNVAPDRRAFAVIVGQVSEDSFEEHGFLLSTLVCRSVNSKPTMPGPGYWPFAARLLKRSIGESDHREVFEEQLQKIYRHYAKQNAR